MLPELGWIARRGYKARYYGPTRWGDRNYALGEIDNDTFVINSCDCVRSESRDGVSLPQWSRIKHPGEHFAQTSSEPVATGMSIDVQLESSIWNSYAKNGALFARPRNVYPSIASAVTRNCSAPFLNTASQRLSASGRVDGRGSVPLCGSFPSSSRWFLLNLSPKPAYFPPTPRAISLPRSILSPLQH